MATKKNTPLTVETLKHDGDTRKNIPTAEFRSVMEKDEQNPVRVEYARRNRDLDPQLCGAARTCRTGPIWWSMRRRSTSRKRCIPKS